MRAILYLSLFSVSVAFGAVEIENITFGFSDTYKAGAWAPLTITVRSQDEPVVFTGELVVEVQNFSSDTPLERYATPLRLSTTGRQQKNLYVYCSKNATRLVVQLRSTASTKSNLLQPIRQEIPLPTPIARKDYFVLVLAPSGDKLKRFVDKKRLEVSNNAQVHVKYLPNRGSLLHDWIGYNAVDVLVIRETFLTERHISKAQQTALFDWVQRGGTLIMSGGSNFNALQGSFVEPFLPVELKSLKKTDTIPDALHEQLGFQSSGSDRILFERIEFTPKAGCGILIGTTEDIYVAKRNFGDGQILCLSFDYNAPPFSEQEVGEVFWSSLLNESGKSPRHFADQYALARRHEERIHKQFLSKMSTQVPLIKLLAVILPAYLLVFGGFLLYFGRSKWKSSVYWVGSCLLVLLSVSTIAVARSIFPDNIVADRLSILSVYPERHRAHIQSFVSIRTTAHTKTSIEFPESTFIRHKETELPQRVRTLVKGSHIQLRDVSVEPWHPTTYVKEEFTEQLPIRLEDAWRVTGKIVTHLGNVNLSIDQMSEFSTAQLPSRVTQKIPPNKELDDTREAFARILQQEGVLQYLTVETDLSQQSYIIGWTSQSFTHMTTSGNVSTNDDTLVIFHPGSER